MVLKLIYSDLNNDDVSKDPEDVLCSWAVWRKVIQSAQVPYFNTLAGNYCSDMDTPTVESLFLAPKLARKFLYLLSPMGQYLGY